MKYFMYLLLFLFSSILHLSCQKIDNIQSYIEKEEALTKDDLASTAYVLNRDKYCFTTIVRDVACSYLIGDLKFTIWGIGENNATTIVDKTIGENGEYQIRFTPIDPCIRIQLGKINLDKYSIINPYHDLTFVSPRSGRAYDNQKECIDSMK